MFYRVHYHPYSPRLFWVTGKLQEVLLQLQGTQKPVPRNFQMQKPTLAQITSNTCFMRENTAITVKRNIWTRSGWISRLLLHPIKKRGVTDFCGMLDWFWFSRFNIPTCLKKKKTDCQTEFRVGVYNSITSIGKKTGFGKRRKEMWIQHRLDNPTFCNCWL